MPTPRRRPHCTRCNLPMAGHRRPNGTPICPSMPTPPATPAPDTLEETDEDPYEAEPEDVKPVGAYYKSVRTLADVPYPPDGLYHYRNPNWGTSTVLDIDSHRPPGHRRDDDSLAPTVLDGCVSPPSRLRPPPLRRKMDQHTPHRSRLPSAAGPSTHDQSLHDQSTHPSLYDPSIHDPGAPMPEPDPDVDRTPAPDESISMRVLRTMSTSAAILRGLVGSGNVPDAGLYSTSRSALSAAQRAARKHGLHTGVMTKPRSPSEARARALRSHESTVWMVVGTEKDAVNHLMDLQLDHRTSGVDPTAAPGGVALQTEPYNLGIPRGLIFSQLVMAGIIGGLLVLVALAYW